MLHWLFELLPNPLGLPVQDGWEFGILGLLALVVFSQHWETYFRGIFGAVLQVVARLLVFFVLWAAAYVLLAAVQWIVAHLVLVCGTVVMAVAAIVILSVTQPYPGRKQYKEAA